MDAAQVGLRLAAHPESSRHARALVRTIAVDQGWGDDVADDAMLVVSELVANAVCHGAEPIHLAVEVGPAALTVMVSDAGKQDTPLMPQARSADRLRGRGLALVAAVASDWGEQRHPDDGKTIWAQVRLPA